MCYRDLTKDTYISWDTVMFKKFWLLLWLWVLHKVIGFGEVLNPKAVKLKSLLVKQNISVILIYFCALYK